MLFISPWVCDFDIHWLCTCTLVYFFCVMDWICSTWVICAGWVATKLDFSVAMIMIMHVSCHCIVGIKIPPPLRSTSHVSPDEVHASYEKLTNSWILCIFFICKLLGCTHDFCCVSPLYAISGIYTWLLSICSLYVALLFEMIHST